MRTLLTILLLCAVSVHGQLIIQGARTPSAGFPGYGVQDKNCVGSWSFEDGSTKDYTTYTPHPGTLTNGATITSNGLHLSGSSTQFMSTAFVINPVSNNFSFICWARLHTRVGSVAFVNQVILQQEDNGGDLGRTWLGRLDNNTGAVTNSVWTALGLVTDSSGYPTPVAVFSSLDTWVHLAMTVNITNLTIYANGVSVLATNKASSQSCGGKLRFGAHKAPTTANSSWDGDILQPRMYTNTLTSSDILRDYENTKPLH